MFRYRSIRSTTASRLADRTRMGSGWLNALLAAIAGVLAAYAVAYVFAPYVWFPLKVRRGLVDMVLGTPARALAPNINFFLLYVPECTLLFAGCWIIVRRSRAGRSLSSLYVGTFLATMVVIGRSPLIYFVRSVTQGDWKGAAQFAVFTLLIVGSGFFGALLSVCIHRQKPIPPGSCKQCGYCLRGLPSLLCPECGTSFAPHQAAAGEAESSERILHSSIGR